MNTRHHVVFLRGKKTILRPLEESDLPRCVKWINDPEVSKFLSGHWPMTMPAEKKWFETHATSDSKDSIILAIETSDGVHIGNMGFHRIDWVSGVATSGALIGEKRYWGRGYGTDAKMALLDYAFNTLGLRKVCSQALAFNGRSIAYSKRCGYREEGRLKKHVFRNGEYHDLVELALFREDWLARRKRKS